MIDPAAQLVLFQLDLDKLDRAITSGVRVVESHTQGRVEYRSLADMMTARGFLVGKIAALQNTGRTRRIVVTGRTGW